MTLGARLIGRIPVITVFLYVVISTQALLASPPPLSGTKYIGTGTFPQDYASLKLAFADIVTNTLGGNIDLVLQSGYTSSGETFPQTVPSVTATKGYTMRIYPNATGIVIQSSNTNGTLNLDNTQNLIIDGRVNATGTTKSLTIDNRTGGGSAIQFINDASNNIVQYCILKSGNISASSGTVVFSTTTGSTGNDNNLIDNCDITWTSTTASITNAVYAGGTTGKENNNNTISNCNISNYFHSAGSNGILIGTGSYGFTITGNSFYQTVSRASSIATHYGININTSSGSEFVITQNYIGGSAPQCGGTPWTLTGTSSSRFVGILLTTSRTLPNSVQGNTIANFNWVAGVSGFTPPGIWSGIYLNNTNANVGTVTGNTIGSSTGTGNITVTTFISSTLTSGITVGTLTTVCNISNNRIGSMTVIGSSTVSPTLAGIYLKNGSSAIINNNIIGSTTTPKSMQTPSASTATTGQVVLGIACLSSGNFTVTNNTVCNLYNAYAGTSTTQYVPAVRGIILTGSTDIFTLAQNIAATVTGNTIYNLTNEAPYTGTGLNSAISGIHIYTNAVAGATNVSRNTIHSLYTTASTAAVNLNGIFFQSAYSTIFFQNILAGNFIHSLAATGSGLSTIRGISIHNAPTTDVRNNMIRLGIDSAGASITGSYALNGIYDSMGMINYYHNSIYIGGSGVTGSADSYALLSRTSGTSRTYRNNIFVNARSNGTGTGNHYAVSVGGTTLYPSDLSMNYNIYYTPGTGGKFGRYNSVVCNTLSDWQTVSGLDNPSAVGNPMFLNATGPAATVDLHLAATNPCEGAGIDIPAVTDDFDGQTRSSLTPYDLGADAGNFTGNDLMPPAFAFTGFSNLSSLSNRNITVTIIDNGTGIPVSGGLIPRLWYRRLSPASTAWYSVAGTLSSGNAANSTWTFTLNYAAAGISPNGGDSIQYYFTAQDQATTPNMGFNTPGGALHTNVNTQITAPVNLFNYKILNILSTTLTVGAGGSYATLTGAGGLFETINASELGGNTTVSVLSDLAESGTNELTAAGMAGYSLLIRPADASLKVISNSANLTTSMLRLNGAGKVTLDGSFNGSGQYFRIVNTHTTATQCKPAIEIYGGSGSDTIKNCILETNGGTSSAGTIAVTAGVNTGIIIMNNEIRDAKGTPGTAGAQTAGITAVAGTNVLCVYNNNISNFSQNGISIISTADSSIILGNSLYYNLASNTASSQKGIVLNGGSKHLIQGNYIGGQSPLCAGSALVFPGGTFVGISMSLGSASAATVQNNVVSNLSFTTTSTLSFSGILLGGGTSAVSITARGNTIGHATDTASIVYVTTGNGAINGIIANVYRPLIIDNNIIAGFSHRGSVSAYAVIAGIYTYGNSTNTITNNRIYNIREYAPSTSTVVTPLVGISYYSMQPGSVISQNTIYNLHNLASGTGNNNVAGIFMQLGSGVVSRNRIYNLQSSGAGGPDIMGIYVWDATAWSYVNNQISLSNGSNTNAARVIGIGDTTSLTNNYYYNSIYISGSSGSSGNSYCFLKSFSDTVTLRNNLFYNSRNAVSGNHFAIGNIYTTPAAGWISSASNYNLFITADSTKVGEWGSGVTQTFSQWKASSGGEANSYYAISTTVTAARLFADAASGNLKINMNNSERSYVDNRGIPVAGVTDDYDGDIRHLTTPDIGSDEMYINPILKLTVLIEALYSSSGNTMIPDTMKVYLRRTSSPYTIVDSSSVLLSTAGQGTYNFTKAIRDSLFYLHLSNKSAIETWSKTGVLFNVDTVSYDFTTAANKAYGDNQVLKGTRYCLYSGDVNGDGVIDFGDLIDIDNNNSSFSGGYGPSDLNNDGVVDLTDMIIADNNNSNFISRITPLTGKRVLNPRLVKVMQQ